MSRVAVVFPPLCVSRDFIDYPYFADLGAVQAASVLRARGHAVTLVDALACEGATLAPLEGDDVRLGVTAAATRARVPRDGDVAVVALTPFHRPPSRDPELGAVLRDLRADAPDRPIVLADLYQSGQHVVDAPSEAILAAYPEVDALLRHEAEASLPGLVETLAREGRPEAPFARNGDEPRLSDLPLPAWDLVDWGAYFRFHEDVVRGLGRAAWAFPIDGRSAPLLTSRGCPFRCVHCSSNPTARDRGRLVAPKTQRRHSRDAVRGMLAALVRHGVRRVHLLDELVNVNEAHFDAVLSLLDEHGLAFEIPNGMRADYVLPEHLARMRGRMTTLSVSAESGVQRVVDEVVDKQLDLGAIVDVAARARDASVATLVHFMIGLPGETKAEINGTLAFALDLHARTGAWPSVQFATPLPGTRLAAIAEERGRALPVVRDWGPRFQKAATLATDHVTVEELERFKATFDRRLEAARGPTTLVLAPTHRCNNHCTFCMTNTRAAKEPDAARQRALVVEWRRRGASRLELDGGEPTLAPHLFGLVALARKAGYSSVEVTTNARMASYREYAEQLVRSGVTEVRVSIHGPDAATHAESVGADEAFEQTLAGARNLVAAAGGSVELGANVTLTRINQGKLAAVAELVASLGLPSLRVLFLTPFGPTTRALAPDVHEAAAEATRAIDAFRGRLRIELANVPPCFVRGYEDHLLPDVLEMDERVHWVSDEGVDPFEYLRARRVKKPVCAGCPDSAFCGGFYELDDVPEPSWLVASERLARGASR